MRTFIFALMIAVTWPFVATADDRLVRLYAPAVLVETGVLKHILPRFSLKTQVRVELVGADASADMVLGAKGRAIFQGLEQTWHMEVVSRDHKGTTRFADWLTSDVGQRTILGFAPDGQALFTAPLAKVAVDVIAEMTEEAVMGQRTSRIKCGRCHVTEEGGMWGIGSTPSFSVLRSFEDWEGRFAGFFALNPHPSFTQIIDMTDPFPIDRPSPIAPIELTQDEYFAILAYVAAIEAADLGAPLQHQ